MPSPVLLTVDTELTWRHYAPGECWRRNFERSIEPAGVGLTYQLETLAAHHLKACFFVDPMPALVYGLEPIEAIVAPILAARQEVQLHLHPHWCAVAHPHWCAVARGRDPAGLELISFDAREQRRLIAQARSLLIEAGAPSPTAFRGGSYAANGDTLAALADLGFQYDSSHNGSHQPWPSDLPVARDRIAPLAAGGLVEIPVTQIESRSGRLRHLQICAVSRDELIAALDHASVNRHPLTTVVSHSFELATRDGLRRNPIVQRRFDSLCGYLARNKARHPTVHFGDLDRVPLDAPARPMPARSLRTVRRLTEQFWSGTRYERPAEAATATCGSTIQSLEMLLPVIGL